ncbi:MAG: hypothetical protein KDA46_07470 [Parvularculaceae bacterium]|nr:hypothetical protein [Parvularculaceae bacterium]
MVRVSGVSEVTRNSDGRIANGSAKRKPAGGGGGLSAEECGGDVLATADRFNIAFRDVLQMRAAVDFIICASKRISDFEGANEEQIAELQIRFRAAWEVYEASFPTSVRLAFPDLMGVDFTEFEFALQRVGWAAAPPAARERHRRNCNAIISPEDFGR